MNYKHLFFVLLCLGLNSITVSAINADTEGIYDLLRKQLNTFERSENVPIDVLFFDINYDGVPDALLSYREEQRSSGRRGNGWDLFRFKNGEWERSPFKKMDDGSFDPSNDVCARGDDFYSLTEDGQKPKLVLVYSWNEKKDNGVMHYDKAYKITIDDEGYLKTIPIPELTVEGLYPYEGDEDAFSFPDFGPEYAMLAKRLVPLSIESFYPQKKNEDGKPPPVATAEQEGVAQVSPSSHEGEEKLGMRNEELGIGEKKETNHLWLYAGVVFLLVTAFYFLRKRFSKN